MDEHAPADDTQEDAMQDADQDDPPAIDQLMAALVSNGIDLATMVVRIPVVAQHPSAFADTGLNPAAWVERKEAEGIVASGRPEVWDDPEAMLGMISNHWTSHGSSRFMPVAKGAVGTAQCIARAEGDPRTMLQVIALALAYEQDDAKLIRRIAGQSQADLHRRGFDIDPGGRSRRFMPPYWPSDRLWGRKDEDELQQAVQEVSALHKSCVVAILVPHVRRGGATVAVTEEDIDLEPHQIPGVSPLMAFRMTGRVEKREGWHRVRRAAPRIGVPGQDDVRRVRAEALRIRDSAGTTLDEALETAAAALVGVSWPDLLERTANDTQGEGETIVAEVPSVSPESGQAHTRPAQWRCARTEPAAGIPGETAELWRTRADTMARGYGRGFLASIGDVIRCSIAMHPDPASITPRDLERLIDVLRTPARDQKSVLFAGSLFTIGEYVNDIRFDGRRICVSQTCEDAHPDMLPADPAIVRAVARGVSRAMAALDLPAEELDGRLTYMGGQSGWTGVVLPDRAGVVSIMDGHQDIDSKSLAQGAHAWGRAVVEAWKAHREAHPEVKRRAIPKDTLKNTSTPFPCRLVATETDDGALLIKITPSKAERQVTQAEVPAGARAAIARTLETRHATAKVSASGVDAAIRLKTVSLTMPLSEGTGVTLLFAREAATRMMLRGGRTIVSKARAHWSSRRPEDLPSIPKPKRRGRPANKGARA